MFPGLTNTGATYVKTKKNNSEDGDGDEELDDAELEDEEGDHYLTLPTEKDTAEEKQELQVYPTDNMILATRTEDDVSYLDVYVYDDGAGAPAGSQEEEGDKLDPDVAKGMVRDNNLYIHHDLMLPAFPLCVEWMSFKPGAANDESNVGNFAAIGTFDPTIEIWNLDSIDKAFPDAILGEEEFEASKTSSGGKSKNKKKKKKKNTHVTTHHTGPVLSLSHNSIFRNVLASTSADHTVKLWDLTSCTAVRSIQSIHSNKEVSSSQWFNNGSSSGADSGSVLLTGGYDSQCCVSDVRIDDENSMSKRYSFGTQEDVESVCWSAQDPIFYAGTDQGNVYAFDARSEGKPLWTLHAHDSGISSLQSNRFIDGMLTTGAMGDKLVKLWKVENGKGPSMVLSRDFGCGNVLSAGFAPDIEVAGNLVVGGSSAGLKMWDSLSNRTVRNSFKDGLIQLQKRAREEAKAAGRASRIARKYQEGFQETVMQAETGGAEEEEEVEEED
ncbi:unnamed protein product [Ambrosiozyma monospora]|uniref:Unnamed protein product n=1 Tax=Ambrosiozyma monospora TaxID=43982 RepID=A0ACB5T6X4_AMBMO|nr:unnamed protein product [Ambrosiozyma monospora]